MSRGFEGVGGGRMHLRAPGGVRWNSIRFRGGSEEGLGRKTEKNGKTNDERERNGLVVVGILDI